MDLQGAQTRYIKEQLQKGLQEIIESQKQIATSRIYSRPGSRSGRLLDALTNPDYRISEHGDGLETVTSLPEYIRFLDMKKRGNMQIYNRQVWGILYGETMQNIKYEFREWLSKTFPELLEQFNKKTK